MSPLWGSDLVKRCEHDPRRDSIDAEYDRDCPTIRLTQANVGVRVAAFERVVSVLLAPPELVRIQTGQSQL
jgi:hypothetical protein